jgi:hypothetical protein
MSWRKTDSKFLTQLLLFIQKFKSYAIDLSQKCLFYNFQTFCPNNSKKWGRGSLKLKARHFILFFLTSSLNNLDRSFLTGSTSCICPPEKPTRSGVVSPWTPFHRRFYAYSPRLGGLYQSVDDVGLLSRCGTICMKLTRLPICPYSLPCLQIIFGAKLPKQPRLVHLIQPFC